MHARYPQPAPASARRIRNRAVALAAVALACPSIAQPGGIPSLVDHCPEPPSIFPCTDPISTSLPAIYSELEPETSDWQAGNDVFFEMLGECKVYDAPCPPDTFTTRYHPRRAMIDWSVIGGPTLGVASEVSFARLLVSKIHHTASFVQDPRNDHDYQPHPSIYGQHKLCVDTTFSTQFKITDVSGTRTTKQRTLWQCGQFELASECVIEFLSGDAFKYHDHRFTHESTVHCCGEYVIPPCCGCVSSS